MNATDKAASEQSSRIAESKLHQYAQLAAVSIVAIGCFLILRPFVPALLFAAVVCSATWPVYVRLRQALWNRSTLAAISMTLLLVILVIAPTVLIGMNLADNFTSMIETGKALFKRGAIAPPDWVQRIPMIGDLLADYWRNLASSGDSLFTQWKGLLEPVRNFLFGAGRTAGEGMLQLALAGFVGFFIYRDGEALVLLVRKVLDRLSCGLGDELLDTIGNAVTGVIHGIFGTALAQAVVALAGFLVAGIPGAFLLAVGTFFFSIFPFGPPLIWGGATFWLAFDGQMGWALFMGLWGFFAISSIDNLVKPYLISRSSKLPLILIVLGVFGGMVAFGFIGLFIGPPALAVGLTLVESWINPRQGSDSAASRNP